MKVLFNVSFIVIGVIIASIGEIKFVLAGFLYQVLGIVFEAIRLVLVQRLLSSAEYKMDPLVSLYYFAPVCAIMNFIVSLFFEVPRLSAADVWNVGVFTLLANAMVAFALNVSVVFLVSLFALPARVRASEMSFRICRANSAAKKKKHRLAKHRRLCSRYAAC
jgi:hypothetical protein